MMSQFEEFTSIWIPSSTIISVEIGCFSYLFTRFRIKFSATNMFLSAPENKYIKN
jgi:hypothetical protein